MTASVKPSVLTEKYDSPLNETREERRPKTETEPSMYSQSVHW